MARTRAQSQRLVQGWLSGDNDSQSAILATQLASGDWLTPEWLQEAQMDTVNARALMSYVMGTFRTAGYHVQATRTGTGNAKQYRISGGVRSEPVAAVVAEPAGPPAEVAVSALSLQLVGQHPSLGHTLIVRALALTPEGVMVHLSDGDGGAWQAVITGYVSKGGSPDEAF